MNFEQDVRSDLAELKSQMRQLLGNGQPGRLHELEQRVTRHEAFVQRARGLAYVLAPLLTGIHVLADYLRIRWTP